MKTPEQNVAAVLADRATLVAAKVCIRCRKADARPDRQTCAPCGTNDAQRSAANRRPAPPTARQLAIRDYMLEYQREHGAPPTIREIGAACGIASTNAVADHLQAMAKKGLVRHRENVSRGWVALEAQP